MMVEMLLSLLNYTFMVSFSPLFILILNPFSLIAFHTKITFLFFTTATPTFIDAPSDTTVEEGETVRLPCRAQGRPKARIIWDRISTESKTKVDEGMIMSRSIRSINETQSKWKRETSVDDNNIEIESENNVDASNEKSITPNLASTHSSTILFFANNSSNEPAKLEVAENGELILRNVTRTDQGWYSCAALNEAGSVVKRVYIHVLSDTNPVKRILTVDEMMINRVSNDQKVVINSVLAISPNSLDVTWDTSESITDNSITFYYRMSGTNQFQITTTPNHKKEYTIGDLKAHTEYEIFATIPKGLNGSVSNMRKGKTLDGPPDLPPVDVRIGIINTTAAYVRWSPPPINSLNGKLSGYKVRYFSLIDSIDWCFFYFFFLADSN